MGPFITSQSRANVQEREEKRDVADVVSLGVVGEIGGVAAEPAELAHRGCGLVKFVALDDLAVVR